MIWDPCIQKSLFLPALLETYRNIWFHICCTYIFIAFFVMTVGGKIWARLKACGLWAWLSTSCSWSHVIMSDSQLLLRRNKRKTRVFYKNNYVSNLQGCKKTIVTQQQHLPKARSTLQNVVLDSQPEETASSVTVLSAGSISKLEQDPHGQWRGRASHAKIHLNSR